MMLLRERVSNVLSYEDGREKERARLLEGDVISQEWVDDGYFTKEELSQNYEEHWHGWVKVRSPTDMENARFTVVEGTRKAERLKAEIARLKASYEKTIALISAAEQRLKS